MPITRCGTKRPREPSLQLNIVFGQVMRRIGGRLRSGYSGSRGVVVEIPPLTCLRTNSQEGGHYLVGSLTGVVASKRVTEASKAALSTLGHRA